MYVVHFCIKYFIDLFVWIDLFTFLILKCIYPFLFNIYILLKI